MMLSLVRGTVRAVFGALVMPVVADVWLKRTMLAKSLRMGYDEVRREFKDMMGDPQIKSARRSLALQWAAEDAQSVRPAANAIIANPQHFAVALRFSETDTPVPLVIGSGADGEALTLQALARRDGVPVVRFPRLARALYALGTAGEPIPPDTYAAVAFVYHLIETLEDGPGPRDDLDLSMCDDDDTLLPDGFEQSTSQRFEGRR
jgi:type III secretion protein U